ncbi:di-trans,poly-cis-decaprenylcistransferase [Nevskia soli]|jgi:undecaprenyl diphosphate synthase|uniref:di-trans,poly-cis-decaprenylcistransferase n=1 Tax=Nevskia soli TaxID=418856 RepID=UPI0015D8F068|nr:di-trans,poly-cis-decaprenylcistransferase [Nevskia soli]
MPLYFTKQSTSRRPNHTAIIMDGNGRWANARGWPRVLGHQAGAQSARRIIEAAPQCGIQKLSLYAFSSDNWSRPAAEVTAIMTLMRSYLATESQRCVEEGVRISVIGRRDRLPAEVLQAVTHAEQLTAGGSKLHVQLAIDYSARDAIINAAQQAPLTRDGFSRAIGDDVDLLIRTGGEQRLSDFLLWESAYAELVFSPRLWPDFRPADLQRAAETFAQRDRRFGGIPAGVPDNHHLGQSWFPNAGDVHHRRRNRWLR